MGDRGSVGIDDLLAVILLAVVGVLAAIVAPAIGHAFVGAETLAISDAKFGAVMVLAGVFVTSLGAVVVAWVQGRKTRASHTADHGNTHTFMVDEFRSLRHHMDGRFDHVDARLDSHDTRITRVENRP